ncbi:MAG: methyltransferase [Microcystis sp. M090S1]|uniref:class I SAM-dependent methyltransferase n=1 Tax=Microcystis sp. M090S1 TaxID=2771135 RepID=UPI002583E97F|nr:methyltransferase [Microcystis sp. M090S1]MCA2812329.1 methyltransferase [Microcystis sp. M090S1]
MNNYKYIGSELNLFGLAKNWKKYCYVVINKYLGEDVLEVGAGIGSATKSLCCSSHRRWLCLEPDNSLVETLESRTDLPVCCEIQQGTLSNLSEKEQFNTIIYIDVLEHIEDDHGEIKLAVKHLQPGGFLIVLSPAHQWLFSEFDLAIGHYRRYNRNTLKKLTTNGLLPIRFLYLDSVGLLASLSNRFLQQKTPTLQQIKLWDRLMVPISVILDPVLRYNLGKSIVGIWQKEYSLECKKH